MALKKTSKPSRTLNASHDKGRLLEQMVRLLESGLADRECQIICRHHLTDKATGQPREVDIYIANRIAGRLHEMVIECRHHAAKVNVMYIDQIVTKRADIGHPKVCVVSRSGFTKAALAKAARHGILTATVAESQHPRWCAWLVEANFVELRPGFEIQRWQPIFASEGEPTLTDEYRNATGETPIFFDMGSKHKYSFLSLLNATTDYWREPLVNRLNSEGEFDCILEVALPSTCELFIQAKDAPVGVVGIRAALRVFWQRHPFQVSFNEYRDLLSENALADIAYGHLSDGTLIAFTDQPAGKKLMTIVPKNEDQPFDGSEVFIFGEDPNGHPLAARIDLRSVDPKTGAPTVRGVWQGEEAEQALRDHTGDSAGPIG